MEPVTLFATASIAARPRCARGITPRCRMIRFCGLLLYSPELSRDFRIAHLAAAEDARCRSFRRNLDRNGPGSICRCAVALDPGMRSSPNRSSRSWRSAVRRKHESDQTNNLIVTVEQSQRAQTGFPYCDYFGQPVCNPICVFRPNPHGPRAGSYRGHPRRGGGIGIRPVEVERARTARARPSRPELLFQPDGDLINASTLHKQPGAYKRLFVVTYVQPYGTAYMNTIFERVAIITARSSHALRSGGPRV